MGHIPSGSLEQACSQAERSNNTSSKKNYNHLKAEYELLIQENDLKELRDSTWTGKGKPG